VRRERRKPGFEKKITKENGGDNSLSNRYRKETLVAHKP